jgi:hypothetical protein
MPSPTTFIPFGNFDFYRDGLERCTPVDLAIYWFAETEAVRSDFRTH